MTRLCKDCKWMREPGLTAECVAPSNWHTPEQVTGFEKGYYRWRFCENTRKELSDACGPDGRWFKAAE